jgi:hypothetical protein
MKKFTEAQLLGLARVLVPLAAATAAMYLKGVDAAALTGSLGALIAAGFQVFDVIKVDNEVASAINEVPPAVPVTPVVSLKS